MDKIWTFHSINSELLVKITLDRTLLLAAAALLTSATTPTVSAFGFCPMSGGYGGPSYGYNGGGYPMMGPRYGYPPMAPMYQGGYGTYQPYAYPRAGAGMGYHSPMGSHSPMAPRAGAMGGQMAPVTQAAGAPTSNAVTIQGMRFAPGNLTVAKGTQVTWVNNDRMPHNIVGQGFRSSNLSQGQSFSHTFSEAGTYTYQCSLHPGMTGTITVE